MHSNIGPEPDKMESEITTAQTNGGKRAAQPNQVAFSLPHNAQLHTDTVRWRGGIEVELDSRRSERASGM